MAIQACSGCGQQLAWGLFRCPRCQTIAPLYAEAERLIKKGTRTMPRITAASGPSNAGAAPGEVGYMEPERAEGAVEIRGEDGSELVTLPKGAELMVAPELEVTTAAEARKQARARKPRSGGVEGVSA